MAIDISVIVPIYNVEEYIEDCARSLFEQTIDEGIEYVFVNDASTDNSIEILKDVIKSYPNREHQIRIIMNDFNHGVAATRQKGIDNARGEYVIHCDPDDWIDRNMYSTMLDFAKRNPSNDIIISDFYVEHPDYTEIAIQKLQSFSYIDVMKAVSGRSKKSIHGSLWNKLIRRTLYSNVKFVTGVDYCEDVLFLIKILAYKPEIAYLPIPLYHYRVNRYSIVNTIDLNAVVKDDLLISELRKNAEENDGIVSDCYESLIINVISNRAFRCEKLANIVFYNKYRIFRHTIDKNQFIPTTIKTLLRLSLIRCCIDVRTIFLMILNIRRKYRPL